MPHSHIFLLFVNDGAKIPCKGISLSYVLGHSLHCSICNHAPNFAHF